METTDHPLHKDEEAHLRMKRGLDEKFLDEKELADRWHLERKTIQKFRYEGGGPPFYKFGRSVRYALSDVIAYEDAHKSETTTNS